MSKPIVRPVVSLLAVVTALLPLPVAAQIVLQQPSFGVTTAGGTVIVPDGGSASLGGVASSASGSAAYGFPVPGLGNRAFGRSSGSAGMTVHATIIDFREMEATLAAEAAGLPGGQSRDRPPRAAAPQSFAEELAAIRAAAATPREAREAVARAKLDRGLSKLEAGDLRLARSWLVAARNEGDDDVRRRAGDLLSRIETALSAARRPPAPRFPRAPPAAPSPAIRGTPAASPRPDR